MGAAGGAARRAPGCRRSTTRCASSSSSRSTGRCARSSPTASSAAVIDGTVDRARARRARAAVRGVPDGRRRGDREREGDPSAVAAARPGLDRARIRGAARAGRGRRTSRGLAELATPLDRRDRATLLAWLALSRTGALAPGSDVGGDEPGLVRRAAAARARSWPGLHEAGLDEGDGVGDRGPRPGAARPAPAVARSAARRGRPTARLLDAWLASDVVRARSGSTPGRASSTLDRDEFAAMLRWAVRLDAIERDEAAPRAADASLVEAAARGRRGGRLPRRGAQGRARCRRRRPVIGDRSGTREAARRSRDRRRRPERPDAEAAANQARQGRLVEQDPPEQRRRRRPVGDDRLEVRPIDEARRLAEAADDARLGHRVGAARIARRDRGPAARPRARCPTSPSTPRSRSTAGSTTAAPGRTWRAPRPPPGSRRRPSAPTASSSVIPAVWIRASMIALVTARR